MSELVTKHQTTWGGWAWTASWANPIGQHHPRRLAQNKFHNDTRMKYDSIASRWASVMMGLSYVAPAFCSERKIFLGASHFLSSITIRATWRQILQCYNSASPVITSSFFSFPCKVAFIPWAINKSISAWFGYCALHAMQVCFVPEGMGYAFAGRQRITSPCGMNSS